jgi:hypothetical protein
MGEHTTTSPPRTRSGVFPARPDQVREARKLISAAVEGCPAAGDAILCISELPAQRLREGRRHVHRPHRSP